MNQRCIAGKPILLLPTIFNKTRNNTKSLLLRCLKMKFLIISLIIVDFVVTNECDGSHRIFKRVINGVPLNGRPSTYTAIRYYGVLTRTNNPFWNYIAYWDYVKPTEVWCSGSLLTPGIFQTACHCLADFDKNDGRFLKPPIVKHNWEGQAVVYVGVSKKYGKEEESIQKYNYIKTKKFMVHLQCAAFGNTDTATHDYGIVQLDAEWIKHDDRPPTYPWIEIEWAPLYTEKAIKEFHEYALRKQLVCLLIGFGMYSRDEAVPISDVLRTGWGILMSVDQCIRETSLEPGKNLTILRHFNWVCTARFPKHDQEGGPGDSGGPLSCGNRYFAVLSGFQFLLNFKRQRVHVVTRHHSLTHSFYTNALDYRKSFIHAIDDTPIYITRRLSDMDYDTHRYRHSSLKHSKTIPHSFG